MQLDFAVKQFPKHLELERGGTPCTVCAYTSGLGVLRRYLDGTVVRLHTDCVTPVIMRRYVSWLAGAGYRPAALQRRVACASSMWKWLVAYDYAIANPCAGLVLPRKGEGMPAARASHTGRGQPQASLGSRRSYLPPRTHPRG